MSPSISIIIGFKCFHNQIFIFAFLQSDEHCKCKIKVKTLKNLYLFYPSKPTKKAGNPYFSKVSGLKLTAGIEPATYALRAYILTFSVFKFLSKPLILLTFLSFSFFCFWHLLSAFLCSVNAK